jgi:hypothetical protein
MQGEMNPRITTSSYDDGPARAILHFSQSLSPREKVAEGRVRVSAQPLFRPFYRLHSSISEATSAVHPV